MTSASSTDTATTVATAVRPRWGELPVPLREKLAARVGGIENVTIQGGGFTPGLAARIRTSDGGRVFAKGIGADHVLAGKYRAEAETARRLPARTPAPRLRWSGELAGWVVLVFDDAPGRPADLSPAAPEIDPVVATVASLATILTPSPLAEAPPASTELADLVHGWRELAENPPDDLDHWARRHLDELAALETGWLAAADGTTLLHGDINASNLIVQDSSVSIVDWAQPIVGASWIDVVDLVPQLILAGHSPQAAEQAVSDTEAWRSTDPDMITSYAVAFAGYWARMCRQPAPPGVPHLRAHQARACHAACRWTAHRTGWTPAASTPRPSESSNETGSSMPTTAAAGPQAHVDVLYSLRYWNTPDNH